MTKLEQEAIDIAIPAICYALQLLFPAVPAPVWPILFKGLQNGDIDGAAIQAFLVEHNIHAYADYSITKNEPFSDKPTEG